MKKYLLTALLLLLASCGSSTITLTDRFEDHATVIVPSHVECMEVSGKRIDTGFSLGSRTVIEIPVGRTEVVFRFYRIYDINEDDHHKVRSEKMTAVFVAEKNNNYEIMMPEPLSLEEAEDNIGEMKGYLVHKESGSKISAIRGIIEERYHGIQLKEPYQELKYWWKKATDSEKDNFYFAVKSWK